MLPTDLDLDTSPRAERLTDEEVAANERDRNADALDIAEEVLANVLTSLRTNGLRDTKDRDRADSEMWRALCAVRGGKREQETNKGLRAQVEAIREAMVNNAAPMNVEHALRKVERVQISSDLLLNLLAALAAGGAK